MTFNNSEMLKLMKVRKQYIYIFVKKNKNEN